MAHTPLTARPPLASLETVCTVAREGSFSAAAEATGVTHGAISRRVQAVENWLGYALFERHGRGVRLTPDGQILLGRIEQAFSIIDGATDQWRTRAAPRLVKISVSPAFANLWLLDRLPALEAGPPALRIELAVEHRNADVAAGAVDIAVRYGSGPWRGVDVEPLMPETLYPVAAPALASQLRAKDPRHLLDWPLLHDSELTGWRAWFAPHGIALKPRPQDRRFEDYNVVLAAAQAGLGIALARVPVADAWLSKHDLVRVSRFEVASPRSYHLLTAKRETRPEVIELMARMRRAAQERGTSRHAPLSHRRAR
ncbi:LysR substrate-binding domain-containing protein [Trinickia fusca]|uniref:LysR family transcriptional regulator n=1 Tax=Trinickia fusca TaxID=2419777 RepID=A0A494XD09_9BURK|nr:LysR substrate-binding domain-containing protein [Trinickia fusca]RKP47531.1 LysR family transcriptional regulator [Trinickia fusca]